MAFTNIQAPKIVGISTCIPTKKFDNIKDTTEFKKSDVRKVVSMAGIYERRIADDTICSSDLCVRAAETLMELLQWERESIDAVIMVTQTPDYFLPSTSCVVHNRLNLPDSCAAFDVGLGCSGYTYGMWLASTILAGSGFSRILLLHGETPSRFVDKTDRAVALLFGDAGSATALEKNHSQENGSWYFSLHSDGKGYKDMIVAGGGFRDRFSEDPQQNYLYMNGAKVFNFTISKVPALINDTLDGAGIKKEDVDQYIFHQSNQYIIQHITKKVGLPQDRVPMCLRQYGNTGGVSVPLTITQGGFDRPSDKNLSLMLLGYGVGLSWSSALVSLEPDAVLNHVELDSVE